MDSLIWMKKYTMGYSTDIETAQQKLKIQTSPPSAQVAAISNKQHESSFNEDQFNLQSITLYCTFRFAVFFSF